MKPINPRNVQKHIPPEVIAVFNDLIARNLSGNRARVEQEDVVRVLVESHGYERDTIFKQHLLDVEELFEREGWKVEYDKPGFNETYGAFFVFQRAARGGPEALLRGLLDATSKSFREFAGRVTGVRLGPIEGEQAWVLFEFDGRTYRMPDPDPEVIQGSEDTLAAKRLCVRAILDNTAEAV